MPIERNIPIPPAVQSGRRRKYPYAEMSIGDSVFIPHNKIPGPAYSSAMSYGLRNGKRFTGRQMDGGVRIWRVE